jgi:DNA mismatch repair protein MutS
MVKDPYATPAMQQWTRCKRQHPDCILFFRMGDFYELFGPDAESMGRALGLAVVDRGNGIPVAGVPHHQKTTYLQRALEAGFRVAVVDQLQDPKDAKGVVERGVTQVITPGTLVDESMLRDEQSVTLAGVAFLDEQTVGAAMVELSTGLFEVVDGLAGEIVDELARRGVREVLYAEPLAGEIPERVKGLLAALGASGTGRASWHFRRAEAEHAVTELFGVRGVEGFGIDAQAPSLLAAGAVVRYLRETQAVDREPSTATSGGEFQRQRVTLAHIRPPRRVERDRVCGIDATSLRALEIEQTIRDGQLAGSLAGVFLSSPVGTRCVVRTPMGKRLLRAWLSAPSRDAKVIRERQDTVAALVGGRTLADAIGERLKGVSDVARIAGRVALGRASPRDLVCLADSTLAAPALVQVLEQAESLGVVRERLEVHAKALTALGTRIKQTLVDDAPGHLRDGGAVRDGVDAELDEARNLEKDAGVWLVDYQTRLIGEHDLPSLKVGFNSVFGYYIELPAAQARRAPDGFTRKQTLKNAERYITPELKTFEDKVTTASARALERERIIFDGLCERARQRVPDLVELRRHRGGAGCAARLCRQGPPARLGASRDHHQAGTGDPRRAAPRAGRDARPSVRPERLRAGRGRRAGHASPSSPARTWPARAPTSARRPAHPGLAQAGSFVPADRATIGLCDRIFTRVGADDALHARPVDLHGRDDRDRQHPEQRHRPIRS